MATRLQTTLPIRHHRLLRKMEQTSGLSRGLLVERALELLADSLLRDPKARALLDDISAAEADVRAGRTVSLKTFERTRRSP